MGVNLETDRFERTHNGSRKIEIAAPSVTSTSVIVLTPEVKSGSIGECYVYEREPGVGFTAITEETFTEPFFVNWAVFN